MRFLNIKQSVATPILVDSQCDSVTIKQSAGTSAAFHVGADTSVTTAKSAGLSHTFTGPFMPGDVAGYAKVDAGADQTFSSTENPRTKSESAPQPASFSGYAGSMHARAGEKATIDDVDALSVGGKIIAQTHSKTFLLTATLAAKSHIFIAERACKVVSVKHVVSVGASGATLKVRKITDASAPDAAAGATVKELVSSGSGTLDLNATANTVQIATVVATAADVTLAAGDKIAISPSGTLTGLVGALTLELQAA